jgi:hypothetical protein
MSGTYTSEATGDWGTAGIWSTDSVPNSSTADVTIDTDVTIAAGESFITGPLTVATGGSLEIGGSVEATAGATLDGGMSLAGGVIAADVGLALAGVSAVLGGSGTVTGSIDTAGLIYAAGGLLDLTGSVTGSGPLEIDLANNVAATLELGQVGTGAVAFVGADPASLVAGVLRLDQPGSYSGTISGFAFGDAIDLAGVSAGTLTTSFSGTTAGGTLTVSNGTNAVAALIFAGNYTNQNFTLIADGRSGTDVELVGVSSETAVASGNWSDPAIWSPELVPNSGATDVTIAAAVRIASGQSFAAHDVVVSSGLEVDGTLNAGGAVTIGEEDVLRLGPTFSTTPTNGFVEAISIEVQQLGTITGVGIIASSGTLTNDGVIGVGGAIGAQLTLAPEFYQQNRTGGDLSASFGGTLVLAPTRGAGGFTNLANGTLTGGAYDALVGTLILPGSVTDIVDAHVSLESAPGTLATIDFGGAPLQNMLGTVGSDAGIGLSNYDFQDPGTLTIANGRIDMSQAVLGAASLILTAGSSAIEGTGAVLGSIDNNALILATSAFSIGGGPGSLDLAGSITGTGSLEIGGAQTLELGSGDGEGVIFDPISGSTYAVLQLDDPSAFAGAISGFAAQFETIRPGETAYVSDSIDLPGFSPGSLTDVYNGTTAGGVLDVLAPGSIVASLTFLGDYASDNFALLSDGHGGTDIELLLPGAVPCFARGTRIATPAGEVAVENLCVGDRVLTTEGAARPIVWIGERRVDCRRHPRPWLVHPVRIRAGAFADGMPQRDLLLSPDHALFCDDVLIPVQQLINGATIVQEKAERIHYFHIELDRHAVVLAEALPAESYLNTGNRQQFENGGGAISLFPDFAPNDAENGCAPRRTRGAIVENVSRRVWQRAVALGAQARRPEISVEAGGRRLRAAMVSGRLHRFLLPADATEARIIAPAHAHIGAILVDGRIMPNGLALGLFEQSARLQLPERRGRQPARLLELLLHQDKTRRTARFRAAA